MSKAYFKITATSLFFFLFLVSCTEQKLAIESPKVVGIPPQNAYTGLVMLDDGEIRHYGPNLYIYSKDQGAHWDPVAVEDGNLYGKKDPLSGEYIRVFAGKDDAVFAVRSTGGIDGEWTKTQIDNNGAIIMPKEAFTLVIDETENRYKLLHRVAKIGYEKQLKQVITLADEDMENSATLDLADFSKHPEKYTIVDIRNKSEVEQGKIFKSAISHPLNELRTTAKDIPTDKPIVVHCAGGYRSAAGSSVLQQMLNGPIIYDLSDDVKGFIQK